MFYNTSAWLFDEYPPGASKPPGYHINQAVSDWVRERTVARLMSAQRYQAVLPGSDLHPTTTPPTENSVHTPESE